MSQPLSHEVVGSLRDDCHVAATTYRIASGELMVEMESWKRSSDDPQIFRSVDRIAVAVLDDPAEHQQHVKIMSEYLLKDC